MLGTQMGLLKVETRASTNDAAFLARLAADAEVPFADLLAISYGSEDRGHAVFRGSTIAASLLKGSRTFRLVCPECLAESPYHRAAWDLSFSSACPIHHRLLVDTCPDCGKPLRWRGVDLTLCGCSGGDLTKAQSSEVPPGTLDGLRLAWGILGDDRFENDVAKARALPLFKGMPEVAILEFVYRLGMDLTPGPRRKLFPLEHPGNLEEQPHMALHHGLAATQSWPDGLELAFASVNSKDWAMPPGIVNKMRFKAVASWLSSLPPETGHNIREALKNLVAKAGIGKMARPVNH